MSNYKVYGEDLTSVANAIRSATGGTTSIAFPGGFVSEIAKLAVADPFNNIYKSLAFRSQINYNDSYVSEWANSLSYIGTGQFAEQLFSGNFTFSDVSHIDLKAFAFAERNGQSMTITLSFPKCTTISGLAFMNRIGSLTINIPSVTSIYQRAFDSCNLINISAPNLTSIESSVFQNTQLSIVDLPNLLSVANYAFQSCSKLTSVSLSNCTAISMNAFYGCSQLLNLSAPKCKAVANAAFRGCSSLTNIEMRSLNAIGISAFESCINLASVVIPSVTTIGSTAFSKNSQLTFINCQNARIINPQAFYQCSLLKSINCLYVEIIGNYAFSGCTQLSSIPRLLSLDSLGIGAFRGCTSLSYISLAYGCGLSSIQDYTFYGCTSLYDIYLSTSSMIALNNINAFAQTPISGGVGRIHVPASLYNTYRQATNWVTYSAYLTSS